MQRCSERGRPPPEVMVRLIEEALWCGEDSRDDDTAPSELSDDALYLRTHVFPTLIPALYEYAKLTQRRLASGQEATGVGDTAIDPITWIAHYMLRNHAESETTRTRHHPFNVVNDVALARANDRRTSTQQ